MLREIDRITRFVLVGLGSSPVLHIVYLMVSSLGIGHRALRHECRPHGA